MASNAIRIVVDITGGAIHAVYAGQPVEIVFISHDGDEIQDQQGDGKTYKGIDGEEVAIWMDGCDVDESKVVEHFFNEYKGG